MRSDKEIMRLSRIDIKELTDEEFDRYTVLSSAKKYAQESQSSKDLGYNSGGKVCKGRKAASSAEKQ